jgi:mRNA interferase HigB
MRVVSRGVLREFWKRHPDAEGPLKAWFREVDKAAWTGMADIKRTYATASIIDSERVVFNICGTKYRLIVKFWFPAKSAWIKFIGTHAAYDRVDIYKL